MTATIREFRSSDFDELLRQDRDMSSSSSAPVRSARLSTTTDDMDNVKNNDRKQPLEPYDQCWLRRITHPDRISYRNYHTYVAESGSSKSNSTTTSGGGGEPVGFLIFKYQKNGCFRRSGDDDRNDGERRPTKKRRKERKRADFIELFFLSVSSRHRRRGVGRALLDRALRAMLDSANPDPDLDPKHSLTPTVKVKAKGAVVEEMRLHVLEDNRNAIGFYERCRFEKLRLVKNYPQWGYNSWRMRLVAPSSSANTARRRGKDAPKNNPL
uniref:N-acetyltransferase domain-containing protein n=1 Tax=Odontella aurita TaxID=265563 RepID=A0A7S4JKV2_9STRA|eukprot:CAMPEP_0113545746 /NCGR_PEP_ID=MMETSP0015_2-20120614/11431_1 /TAXON_ID=2838 /ORGANISM="Odontella" /LENGTH=268 /DNA_ID=CAMNT_0000446143 /DNA_START=47 /DNA_END=853 /DNA_ORIENTATION=- /assembly_acc=CAM_ASM_000160